jgi:hypothetical protein
MAQTLEDGLDRVCANSMMTKIACNRARVSKLLASNGAPETSIRSR